MCNPIIYVLQFVGLGNYSFSSDAYCFVILCYLFSYVPFVCTGTMQQRAFFVIGPTLWNGLHPELRAVSSSRVVHRSLCSEDCFVSPGLGWEHL